MKINQELIKYFRDDLCKDQREIKILSDNTGLCASGKLMRKYNATLSEYNVEINIIKYLLDAKIEGIPQIIGGGFEVNNVGEKNHYVDMEYYDGIRIYNLLASLRAIKEEMPHLQKQISELRLILEKRCLERQIKIQKALIDWGKQNNIHKKYPQEKLIKIVSLLCDVMKLNVNRKLLNKNLQYVINEFYKTANIPFRDSTTKNMVIHYPKLYLEHFLDENLDALSADERRKQYIIQMLKNGEYKTLFGTLIADFDFSSCQHLTSKYDDPIGYICHEINWRGIPDAENLIWNSVDTIGINGKDIAISFIVRFLRFGGRKMAYHIFHPSAYIYRFKYDNENFYFENLNLIVRHFWKNADDYIPEFMHFIDEINNLDKSKVIDSVDEFALEYPNCNRKFYVDIFPY